MPRPPDFAIDEDGNVLNRMDSWGGVARTASEPEPRLLTGGGPSAGQTGVVGEEPWIEASVQDRARALWVNHCPMWIRRHPVSSIWLGLLIVSSVVCVFRPATKSALCLHWPGILREGERYRGITTFLCLGGQAFEMRGVMELFFLSGTVSRHEEEYGHLGRGTDLLQEMGFGALALLAMQYYGGYKGWYATPVMGFDLRHWVNPQARWLSYDLVFYMLCCASFDQGSRPTVLNLGIPIGPMPSWLLPFVLAGVHMLMAGGRGVHTEALLAALAYQLCEHVRGRLEGPPRRGLPEPHPHLE
jgi:hypothetical protein